MILTKLIGQLKLHNVAHKKHVFFAYENVIILKSFSTSLHIIVLNE